jgi:hypothetical protein
MSPSNPGRNSVSWQTSKTWKSSNDPEFTTKMRRILYLYDQPPAGGRVICVDEFGPLNLQPRPGKAWKPRGEPVRLRATYHRDHGVWHMIASLDLATGKLQYRIRDRKRSSEFLAFLKSLRRRWPGQTLHLILDNFSPHKHPTSRAWSRSSRHGLHPDRRILRTPGADELQSLLTRTMTLYSSCSDKASGCGSPVSPASAVATSCKVAFTYRAVVPVSLGDSACPA